MIVDDDAEDRDLFCEALAHVLPHVECISVPGGTEAINHLRSTDQLPQFVFLDIRMDDMDGKECLLRIKRIKSIERVSIVMYSSSLEGANEISVYRKLGATHVMEKPSTFTDLCANLSKLFHKN
jgi:CheY-like chemotaxis protein